MRVVREAEDGERRGGWLREGDAALEVISPAGRAEGGASIVIFVSVQFLMFAFNVRHVNQPLPRGRGCFEALKG